MLTKFLFRPSFYTGCDVDSLPNLRQRIAADLHKVAINPQTPDILPSNLRPAHSPSKELQSPERLTGNIITDVTKCELNFNVCIRRHMKMHPECPGDVVFGPHSISTWGLGISGRLKCSVNCGFTSDKMKFYQEIERTGRGRRAARINTQLQVVLTKQPFGNAAVREVLASIDAPCPSESGMQKTANNVSDAFRGIAEKQLGANRKLVKTVMNLRGRGATDSSTPTVIVAQSDVAYNNPIKGRSFYQPGTQAWAPCFAGEPGLEHVPIAFQTRSKVCSCQARTKPVKHKEHCEMNFPANVAMGNAELELGKALAKELIEGEEPLGVNTLVTDGDSHLHKGLREVMLSHGIDTAKGDCTRHITKSISRNIQKAKLSDKCLGEGKTAQQKARNKRTLANFIERRCSMEFRAAFRKHDNGNLEQLLQMCGLAKIGILGCIQGHPDICRQSSNVCGAHRWKSGNKVGFSVSRLSIA